MKNIKVGFSASKKIGGSVQRHRVLRKMREAIKPHLAKMTENHSYIFVAKDGIQTKSVAEISATVKLLLERAKLIAV